MSTSNSAAASNSGGLREAISCDVCLEVYERTLKTPLVLPCGHTFCRACLVAQKKTGRFSCPTCRAVHNVQVETLTVNFSLLNILPFCSDFTYEKCTTHGDDLRYWCSTCNLPLCSLCLYSGHPQGHSIKLAQSFVQDKKLEIIEKITLFFGNIEEQKQRLKGCFNGLDAQMKELFHKNAYLQDKLVALTDLLDETQKAGDIASIKYFEKKVKDFQCRENDMPSGTDLKKEGKEKEPSGTDVSKENAKDSQTAEATAAPQSSENEETTDAQRSVIDFREGRLLLHSVAVPASAGLSFQVPSEVFLELSVGDRCLGHVFISLWCHMRRAQQFLALCMGTIGPILLGTKATDKVRSVLTFRYVVDGNSKTRSQPLLTNLEWGGQYAKPETEGYLAGWDYHPERANSLAFGICTQTTVGATMQSPFGRVVGGLEVVQAAFQHNPINEVTITQSGLVLPSLSP